MDLAGNTLCDICRKTETYWLSTCDKCRRGLCTDCYNRLQTIRNNLLDQLITDRQLTDDDVVPYECFEEAHRQIRDTYDVKLQLYEVYDSVIDYSVIICNSCKDKNMDYKHQSGVHML